MATSTNYGWSEPDNSSLVKDGAQAIRTLGDAIDTSVWNVGYGQAGKNKIINGDFKINQRGFTSNTATNSFNFDRFSQFNGGTSGTLTTTPQVFTPGAAPVAGYEGTNFLQGITAAGADTNTFAGFYQRIESVRTFANQAVTISFYAKATTGTPKIGVEVTQNFGSGGSPSAEVNTAGGAVTLSTSFARYSVTFTVPSISGKTLGTTNDGFLQTNLWLSAGSVLATRASSIGIQNNTFQIWGVQVEYGSVATPFQTASGGSPQDELAMCKYYYSRYTSGNVYGVLSTGIASNTGTLQVMFPFPTGMRVIPTAVDTSAMATFYFEGGASNGNTPTTVTIGTYGSVTCGHLLVNKSAAFVSGMPYSLNGNNTATAFIGFSAEL